MEARRFDGSGDGKAYVYCDVIYLKRALRANRNCLTLERNLFAHVVQLFYFDACVWARTKQRMRASVSIVCM